MSYNYDELSRRTKATLGNAAESAYGYDLGNRMTDLDVTVNVSESITYDYTHDKVGNRKTVTVDSSDLTGYDYDKIYQLTDVDCPGSADDLAFGYDALGNRVNTVNNYGTTAYESNRLNQYVTIGEPLAHWGLNDNAASSEAADVTGNGHGGTLYRDGTLLNTSAVSVPGKLGDGFSLDDPNKEYVNCGSTLGIADFGGETGGVITITAWVRPDDVTKFNCITRHFGGVHFFSAGGSPAYLAGKVRAMYRRNGVNAYATSLSTISAGQWSHVALVMEAGVGYRIYIDGELDRAYADSDMILYNYNSTNYIGLGFDADSYFGGVIDSVAVYDRALSDAEVAVLYETQRETVYKITYDNNGNMTADNRGNSYTYDWQNRLITAETADYEVTYTYDALGRRLVKAVNDGVTTETTAYCYSGQQVIAEFDGSGNLKRKYIYGTGIDEPIALIVVNGQTETVYYYHFDGLGSVIALSDANGAIVEGYTYDVFGNCIVNTSAGPDGDWLTPDGTTAAASAYGNPYLYTGRRWDSETGLYYYRYRYYDPAAGRFMSADPIGYADGMNMYAYCGNNTVNFVDPMGLDMVYPGVPTGGTTGGTHPSLGGGHTQKPRIAIYSNPDEQPNRVQAADDYDYYFNVTDMNYADIMARISEIGQPQELYIFGHGAPGVQFLDNSILNARAFFGPLGEILDPGCTIYLMGCDVAQGEEGKNYLMEIAQKTTSYVRASDEAVELSRFPNIFGRDWSTDGNLWEASPNGTINIIEPGKLFDPKPRPYYPGIYYF